MAIYRIFPEKDATLYSDFSTTNTGISEILDLSKNTSFFFPSYSAVGRVLVKFSDIELSSSISKYIGSSSFAASFGMFLANASSIPLDYTLQLYAISESWDMGTGRADDVPAVTNGVTWAYKDANFTLWKTSSFSPNVTASFTIGNSGGGNWYYNTLVTESFNNKSNKDLTIDVSSIVNSYISGTLVNQGFLIKNADPVEFNPNYVYSLIYFSSDTNTIYPPYLDLKWDDSIYSPNTGSMSMIQSNDIIINLGNNRGEFDKENIQRFNLNVREQFPRRTFVTSSLYTVGEYLPATSYWRLRDYDTDNIIFDFDINHTKISTDINGSFFNIYMNGLQPERYYRLEFRVDFNGKSNIYSNDYYFKIKR